MSKHTSTMLLLIVATAAVAAVVRPTATGRLGNEAEVVIRGISLVDVRQGEVRPNVDIVVRATRIASVAQAGGVLPPAKTVIEGRGKYALPGLIDPQVRLAHFTRLSVASLLVEGITAVRDVGTEPGRIAEWRRALAHGQMYAPRVARTCGELLVAAEPGCGDAPEGSRALVAVIRARTAGGSGLHDVLEALVRVDGMSTSDVLRAATLEAVQALVLPDLGEIAPGKAADIVITTANPLEDLRHLRAIDAVVFRGEPLTQAHLNLLRAGRLPSGATAAP